MDTNLEVDVTNLDDAHRRALEDVIGLPLQPEDRLLISVVGTGDGGQPRTKHTLEDWTSIYDGLTEAEIEAIDSVMKQRANLTRFVD